MPKGEHFKKDNPRNYQVSFKVNKSELAQLRKLAEATGLSVPEWLRSHIDNKPVTKVAPSKKETKKSTNSAANIVTKPEQTSLF